MVSAQHSNSNDAAPGEMITKLVSVDSDLAAQEAQLMAQLKAIHQKRQSLQTVIQLFDEAPESAAALADTVAETPGTTAETTESTNGHVRDAAPAEAPPAAEKEDTAPELAPSATATKEPPKQTPSRKGRTKRGTRAARARKGKVKIAPWQFHIKEDYQDVSLPKAVLNVLQESPEDVIDISDIINRIFVSDIPNEAEASARDRLSNVLSVGLKKNKWYRGKTGHYSVSKEVAEASRSSKA